MINHTRLRALPAAIALAACLLAAGCSSSSTTSGSATSPPAGGSTSSSPPATTASPPASTGSAPAAAAVSITIKNFAFTVSGAAAAGSAVKVTNNDTEAHTVTADSGNDFDVTIQPGKTTTFTAPKKAGSYKFHCNFHSNMHGTLQVTA